jgi:hypothetical protein
MKKGTAFPPFLFCLCQLPLFTVVLPRNHPGSPFIISTRGTKRAEAAYIFL